MKLVTLQDIEQAQARITGVAVPTPLLACPGAKSDEKIFFKPESFQPIGSFKLRGAYNRLSALTAEERERGVIAYSSGNHAQGVAYSARELGIKAVIVMPVNAPKVKIEATRSFGAQVVLYNPTTEKREDVTARLMQESPYVLVPPFNDEYVIAGQGTIGLEIYQAFPEVELVIVPVGGGGLVSGVATALKSKNPAIKVIGVEPELANDAQLSFRSGKIVEFTSAQTARTIADGTRTLSVGDLTFAQIQAYVDDIITVSEAEIKEAVSRLLFKAKLVIEPSGAMPFAAFLHHRAELPAAKNIVLVLSGGNIEPEVLQEIISG
jgi:threo-3-hydroxy-L-aspartate ammonia-lyase